MADTSDAGPKVAISYSWSSEEHSAWVLQLAERLVGNGIDVVLDRWDFEFGNDTVHYMERFVNDPTIAKVLLVSDRVYAEKANARQGGVGIESQIISPEVYSQVDQTRFIPIVTEYDESGKPYLPTFLKSRWYVDLSPLESFEEKFEELVRSIYGKPLLKKPPLGKRPRYLDQDGEASLATVYKARTLVDAVRSEKRTVPGLMADYLDVLREVTSSDQLKPFERHINPHDATDLVYARVEPFLPYKSEFLEVITTVCKYGATQNLNVLDALHDFYRDLVPLMHAIEPLDFTHDAGRFVVFELFITCLAVFLRHNRFDEAGYLLEQEYRISDGRYRYSSESLGLNNFNVFSPYMRSFEIAAASRREISNLSLEGKLLLERSEVDSKLLNVEDIVNADIALYCRGLSTALPAFRWSCKTVVGRYGFAAISLFSKAASKSFFDRFKRVLNVDSPEAFKELIGSLYEKRKLSGFTPYNSNDLEAHQQLLSLEELGTR